MLGGLNLARSMFGLVRELKELHLLHAAQHHLMLRSFFMTHEVLSSVLGEHDEITQPYMMLRWYFFTTHEVLSSVLTQQEEMRHKTCRAATPLLKAKLAALIISLG